MLRWAFRILLLALVVDAFYLSLIWPDWQSLTHGPIPKSAFIASYQNGNGGNHNGSRLHWQPVALSTLPKYLGRSVILAEDANFYGHRGFDLEAFKEAMNRNLEEGEMRYGASTISQQTVKNLYLSASRDPLRKWHELILTWGMERHLSKRRILEVYLNVAEFGQGIYGVQAAARHYWGTDAGALSPMQSVELAATLPSPVKHNPATRTRAFEKRKGRVLRLLHRFPGEAAQSIAARNEPPPIPDAADLSLEPLPAPPAEPLAEETPDEVLPAGKLPLSP